jgi:hypothetical protein
MNSQQRATAAPRALLDPLAPGETLIVTGRRTLAPSRHALQALESAFPRPYRVTIPQLADIHDTPATAAPPAKRQRTAKPKTKRPVCPKSPMPPRLLDLGNAIRLLALNDDSESTAALERVAQGAALHSIDYTTLQRVLKDLTDFQDVWQVVVCFKTLQPARFAECMQQIQWAEFVARYFTDHMKRVCVESIAAPSGARSCRHELFVTPALERMHPGSPWIYGRKVRGAALPPRNSPTCDGCGQPSMHDSTQEELAPVLLGSLYLPSIDMRRLLARPDYDIVCQYVRALYEPSAVHANRNAAIHRSWEYSCLRDRKDMREDTDEYADEHSLEALEVCDACATHCSRQNSLDPAAVRALKLEYSLGDPYAASFGTDEGGITARACALPDEDEAERCALCGDIGADRAIQLVVTRELFCALPTPFAERLFWDNRMCSLSCAFSRTTLLPRIAALFGIASQRD